MTASIQVIIVSYNTRVLTESCIETILDSDVQRAVVISLVDNGSTDGTCETVRSRFKQVEIIEETSNLGYAGAINRGADCGHSDYIMISNTDVEFERDAMEEMASFLDANPNVGAVGPQQFYPSGEWQRSYGIVPSVREGLHNLLGITTWHQTVRRLLWPRVIVDRKPRRVSYIDGAVMMIRREAFEEVGGFDTSFSHYAEEADFCVRLQQAGWETWVVPSALVMHIRGASSKRSPEKRVAFAERLVKAKAQFVSKHSGPGKGYMYGLLQSLHAEKMAAAWWFRERLIRGDKRKIARANQIMFRNAARFWLREATSFRRQMKHTE